MSYFCHARNFRRKKPPMSKKNVVPFVLKLLVLVSNHGYTICGCRISRHRLRKEEARVLHRWMATDARHSVKILRVACRTNEAFSLSKAHDSFGTFGPPKPWKMKVLGPKYKLQPLKMKVTYWVPMVISIVLKCCFVFYSGDWIFEVALFCSTIGIAQSETANLGSWPAQTLVESAVSSDLWLPHPQASSGKCDDIHIFRFC